MLHCFSLVTRAACYHIFRFIDHLFFRLVSSIVKQIITIEVIKVLLRLIDILNYPTIVKLGWHIHLILFKNYTSINKTWAVIRNEIHLSEEDQGWIGSRLQKEVFYQFLLSRVIRGIGNDQIFFGFFLSDLPFLPY